MATKSNNIVADLARNKVVETIVSNITRSAITYDLQDLCQIIYLALLETDEELLAEMYTDGKRIRQYITRIALNQFRSTTSPYYRTIVMFNELTTDLDNTRDDEE